MNDLIQAYTLGCLSPEEVKQLRKAIKDDPEFNLKELGKYQNLSALLPSALPVEVPDQKVKEKVAKKLSKLQKTSGEKSTTNGSNGGYRSKDIAKELIDRSVSTSTSERYSRVSNQGKPLTGDMAKSREFQDITVSVMPRYKQVKVRTIITLVSAALIAGLLGGYFLFYENQDALHSKIESLNGQISELNSELLIHNGLLTLLEKKDVKFLPLTGNEVYPDGFGRIYIHNSSNRAYLFLSNLPMLQGNSRYHLWIVNGAGPLHAGTFKPVKSSDYYYFTFPRIEITRSTRILLTEEPEGEVKKPGRRVYLSNQL